jgi:transcriptional regulator
MYQPRHFVVTDEARLHALIEQNPLATWVTQGDGGELVVNHVPFLLDRARGLLIGHVARANPVWQKPARSVLVFQGADAYVSPGWYAAKQEHGKVVPTWNYAVVHAHGVPRAVQERAALLAIVTRLTALYEAGQPAPWAVADAPAEFIEQMLGAIVGIELPIERLEGKWKVSQNRSRADRDGVADALGAHPMAALVRETP